MKNFFAFKNITEGEAELSIHDEIGFWGTQAKDFIAQLKGITSNTLNLHINSPGGSVTDGLAIYNMLRASGKNIVVHVDGIAASIASIIAMAGSSIRMPANTFMFVHEPLVQYASGNAEDLRKLAEDLDKMHNSLTGIYVARTKQDKAKIESLMAEETLLTAQEAFDLGFATEVTPELVGQNSAFEVLDYHPSLKLPAVATTAPVGHQQKTIENDMKLTLEQAEARINVLEGENTQLKTSVGEARNKAQQDAATAENTRKSTIKAIAAKYNKDGDLNEATIDALSTDITPEAFKDKVLDVVNARPSKGAIKPSGTTGGETFEAKYAAAKTVAERQALIRANRAEARTLSRNS